jgi:hypothetical protein
MRTINFTVVTALALLIGCSSSDGGTTLGPGTGQGGSGQGGNGGGGGSGPCSAVPGAELCSGQCVLTKSDPANCGMCGKKCLDGEGCVAGVCGMTCSGTQTKCGTTCVDTKKDAANCGACGQTCKSGEVCADGKCGLTCPTGQENCSGTCANLQTEPTNCGACGTACKSGEFCNAGKCSGTCVGTKLCGTGAEAKCVDINIDEQNCGDCGKLCVQGQACNSGKCECQQGLTDCNGQCVNTQSNQAFCGSCTKACANNETCLNGLCSTGQCAGGLTKCGIDCVNLTTDPTNCGLCGTACTGGNSCVGGQCVTCDSATTDCDGDGWKASDGDCCDKPGTCGMEPAKVNPGAIEVLGNAVDDNCNGKTDLFDMEDTVSCDSGLTSNSQLPADYAKALGICRTTTESPATLQEKTWGLIDAKIVHADGSAMATEDWQGISIRDKFGSVAPGKLEGDRIVVMSSGIASDATQTNPGPNEGAPDGYNVSTSGSSSVDIQGCTLPYCIKDWYATPNLPLKPANGLPDSPGCNASNDPEANDSVMLVLRLRAPTNVRAFSFNTYFFSAEYPEFVCTSFNDQLIALVDTPSGVPSPIPNPKDKNLMTYTQGGQQWPIGINIAKGTSLFSVCEPQTVSSCWDSDVSSISCNLPQGAAQLVGTGFEGTTGSPHCTIGGGTFWLTTAGNVIPGQIVEVRIAIWDVGDSSYDSLALIDGFKWLASATLPGTAGQ